MPSFKPNPKPLPPMERIDMQREPSWRDNLDNPYGGGGYQPVDAELVVGADGVIVTPQNPYGIDRTLPLYLAYVSHFTGGGESVSAAEYWYAERLNLGNQTAQNILTTVCAKMQAGQPTGGGTGGSSVGVDGQAITPQNPYGINRSLPLYLAYVRHFADAGQSEGAAEYWYAERLNLANVSAQGIFATVQAKMQAGQPTGGGGHAQIPVATAGGGLPDWMLWGGLAAGAWFFLGKKK